MSAITVQRVVRTLPSRWVATVVFDRGNAVWTERVAFSRTLTGDRTMIVSVTDDDYPDDRQERLFVNSRRDMRQLIRDYLIAGRW